MSDEDSRMRASRELLDKLRKRKQTNDSYEDVINRLLDQQEQLQELVRDWETEASATDGRTSHIIEMHVDELQDVLESEQ